MLKLKLQYFGHLMQRTDSLERTLMLERLKSGGEGSNRGWDGGVASSTWWTWVWASSRSWWWTGKPGMLQFMRLQRFGLDWGPNWTELNWDCSLPGSSVHGISQARMLEWVAISFSRGRSWPRVWSPCPALAGGSFPLSHKGSNKCHYMRAKVCQIGKNSAFLSRWL